MKFHRILAVVIRHLYNFRRNYDRLVDAFYWPMVDVILWGLTISAFNQQGSVDFMQVRMLIFAVILWFIVWRGQGEISVGLLEELWSENVMNLFASPLKVTEWMLGMCILGLGKLALTIGLTSITAYALYQVNFFGLGLAVVPMIFNLILMGWAFGFLISGMFLRHGTSVQTFAWAGVVVLMPFTATYYPLSSLPNWVQFIGQFLPATYVFEGMRAYVATGQLDMTGMYISFLLNIIFLTVGILFFFRSFTVARNNGLAQLK